MKFEPVPSPSPEPKTHLWLMLPGAYMKPADFIAAGFADAVHRRGLPHAIALLDATIAEVADGSALAFLQEYLRALPPEPAQRICLVGISLGAQVALACLARTGSDAGRAAQAAARVASACVMAPYLGPRDIVAEISATGDLAGWTPGPIPPGDTERRIWRWLQREAANGPDLYLAYGSDDRFATMHAFMARDLPADRVDVQPGGHEWPVWTALWNRHLDHFHAP